MPKPRRRSRRLRGQEPEAIAVAPVKRRSKACKRKPKTVDQRQQETVGSGAHLVDQRDPAGSGVDQGETAGSGVDQRDPAGFVEVVENSHPAEPAVAPGVFHQPNLAEIGEASQLAEIGEASQLFPSLLAGPLDDDPLHHLLLEPLGDFPLPFLQPSVERTVEEAAVENTSGPPLERRTVEEEAGVKPNIDPPVDSPLELLANVAATLVPARTKGAEKMHVYRQNNLPEIRILDRRRKRKIKWRKMKEENPYFDPRIDDRELYIRQMEDEAALEQIKINKRKQRRIENGEILSNPMKSSTATVERLDAQEELSHGERRREEVMQYLHAEERLNREDREEYMEFVRAEEQSEKEMLQEQKNFLSARERDQREYLEAGDRSRHKLSQERKAGLDASQKARHELRQQTRQLLIPQASGGPPRITQIRKPLKSSGTHLLKAVNVPAQQNVKLVPIDEKSALAGHDVSVKQQRASKVSRVRYKTHDTLEQRLAVFRTMLKGVEGLTYAKYVEDLLKIAPKNKTARVRYVIQIAIETAQHLEEEGFFSKA